MIKVALIGATGYTGAESIEILLRHPQAQLTYLGTIRDKGVNIADIFSRFTGRCEMQIEPLDVQKVKETSDVALCCLPHKLAMGFVPQLLDAGVKVIDFSADYRIKDKAVYEKHYQVEHTDVSNIEKAVFGLPELYRNQIVEAELIANPGCFPTTAILGLAPLLKNNIINPSDIIVNSVSGTSGAGKTPSELFHYPNMNENLFAYKVGSHRHTPEMEQITSDIAGKPTKILFQPSVGPFDRGILSNIYTKPTKSVNTKQLIELYRDFYADSPFVQVLNCPPQLKDVAHTNYCHILPTVVKGRIVCFSAIDNLVKGASGQAIQNMNIMFGLDETLGLK